MSTGWWRRLVAWFNSPHQGCTGEMVTLGWTGMSQDVLEHWGKPCPIHDAPSDARSLDQPRTIGPKDS